MKPLTKVLSIMGIIFILEVVAIVRLIQRGPSRSFYQVEGVTFTLLPESGNCYLLPYKYTGDSIPDKDYIIVPPFGMFTIFVRDDSLIIFNDTYQGDTHDMIFNLSSFKYKLIKPPFKVPTSNYEEQVEYSKYYNGARSYYFKNFHHIGMDLRENAIYVH